MISEEERLEVVSSSWPGEVVARIPVTSRNAAHSSPHRLVHWVAAASS